MTEVIKVENLSKVFQLRSNPFKKGRSIRALNNVSFNVYRGEILGVVGESGSGKSTLARILCGVEKPTAGRISILGHHISEVYPRSLRGRIQMVFQDPFSSLNPRMKVKEIIAEPMKVQGRGKDEIERRVAELLLLMGLAPSDMDKYPHEFSGGQRQRISIARALAVVPEILVLDEPTSSLDVFVQAQIINLLLEIKERFGLTYIFISHNIPLVVKIADRVVVMKDGEVVEVGDALSVYYNPVHPYTKELVRSVPLVDFALCVRN